MCRAFIKGQYNLLAALWRGAFATCDETLATHRGVNEGFGTQFFNQVDHAAQALSTLIEVHAFRAHAQALAVVVKDIHRRRTDKAGHELVGRFRIKLARRGNLLQYAIFEHGYPVPQRHGLYLVVGYVDRGGPKPLLQARKLGTSLHAQLCIQVR